MKDEVKITVIATGFDKKNHDASALAAAASTPGPVIAKSQQMPDLEIPTFLRRQR
jgi:hypothetical protein